MPRQSRLSHAADGCVVACCVKWCVMPSGKMAHWVLCVGSPHIEEHFIAEAAANLVLDRGVLVAPLR